MSPGSPLMRRARPVPASAEEQHGGSTSVVFVHGLGSSGQCWEVVMAHLSGGLDPWIFEMPWGGGGGATWAQGRPGRHLDTRFAAMDAPPDIVVAHSFGANVVLEELAAGRMPTVRAAVLVSPFYRPAPESFCFEDLSHYLDDFPQILREGVRLRAGSGRSDELLLDLAVKIQERIDPYGWMRFMRSYLRTPLLDLSRVRVPVLVVVGTADIAAPPRDGLELARRLPEATLKAFDGCGHFPMAERSEAFAALLNDFLASHAGSIRPASPESSTRTEAST